MYICWHWFVGVVGSGMDIGDGVPVVVAVGVIVPWHIERCCSFGYGDG